MRVVLHGGFHKTATSHLQGILQRNSNHLAKRGVMYIHHREVREKFTVPCQRNANLNAGLTPKTKITDAKLRKISEDFFTPIKDANPETLILSDENLYGHCAHIARSGAIYHFKKRFVRPFANEIPFDVTDIFLSIRNYPDFFAAAYTEYLRSTKGLNAVERFVDIEDTMAKVLANPPNWVNIIKFTSKWFPKARIHIWRFEDFREVSPQILQAMCGDAVQYDKLRMPQHSTKRVSPSNKAMQEFSRVRHSTGIKEALEVRLELEKQYPKNEESSGYQPWTSENHALLSNLYDQHWNEICDTPWITTIRPTERGLL